MMFPGNNENLLSKKLLRMYKLIKQNSFASSRCQMRAFVLECQRYIKIPNFASLYSGSLVQEKERKSRIQK